MPTPHLDDPVLDHMRRDFASLGTDLTVEQALAEIRRQGIGERIVYFYVVDEERRLVGVLPVRRLLTGSLGDRLSSLMLTRLVVLPQTATVLEACELFALHRFLSLPVVDAERRLLGVVDVSLLTDEVFDLAERRHVDDVFETIGFRVSQVRGASPLRAFRVRFPWLLATIGSGLTCAFLAGAYELTIAKSIVLAFFLTLVLALGESVSIQSMVVTVQALRSSRPTWRSFLTAIRREVLTSILLGLACGTLVALVAWAWRGSLPAALVIGGGIGLSVGAACVFGIVVPTVLHSLRLDPKIAAGPLTLAMTDIATLLFYFSLAKWFL